MKEEEGKGSNNNDNVVIIRLSIHQLDSRIQPRPKQTSRILARDTKVK